MTKVNLFDRKVVEYFLKITAGISTLLSLVVLFYDIPDQSKHALGWLFIIALSLLYLVIWIWSNRIKMIEVDVEGSKVTIKVGDIFLEKGLKAIAFNEYFDTKVDNIIIAERSLNGIYIKKHLRIPVADLDHYIEGYSFSNSALAGSNDARQHGKQARYQIGTTCEFGDYLLTAFSKFDSANQASLTMPEYLEFLINFWDNVNKVYAQRSVAVPVFGSGLTRIKGHKTISDEDLLKIMLWTFRISEMRFKYPARLTVVIHKDKIGAINLFDIKSTRNGM
ncbi:MAG: DUF6430 domain-containing protein [Cyanobacteria bacterium]|nr:DUF6430 domain-containing protein [Cyanobacteriota bacterium]